MLYSSRQFIIEHANRPSQHSDREMRCIMSTRLPRAKTGHLKDLLYFSGGVREYSEFIVPEVFEAFLEHLKASKVPSVETLPTSFAKKENGSFKDQKITLAFESIRGLANSAVFKDLMEMRTELGELLVACWPDVLSWMWFFFIACFERNLVDNAFKNFMLRSLCMVFTVGCHRGKFTIAIADTPGSIRLATLISMLDIEGTYMSQEDAIVGTAPLLFFLDTKPDVSYLDEILAAVGGDAKLFISTMVTRFDRALNTPELLDRGPVAYTTLFMALDDIPQHPLCVALRARNPIVLLTNALHRLLEFPLQSNFGHSETESAMIIRQSIVTILSYVRNVLREHPARFKLALQALQAGIMTALIDCAQVAFTFEPIQRDSIVGVLTQLSWLSTQLPIARQASADLERLERTCSVQGRFTAATHDVKSAWLVLYDSILARRAILSQMQALDSTPMACDNCYKFDERANFKKCAGCGMAHYCSKDCQARAWKEKGHKAECKDLKARQDVTQQIEKSISLLA
ncbi:hypothetical protein SCHPADRAFT_664388 [Schizopora paradoxa]|uniref:MYND-type domain-containing protein n=1 Tax=Schizopora paradoxa TaxID=27342 RepID=A0A0H2R5P4_9AGAM|nr:hypothetical protein SCHPADRAFT_664388 [Schizopora paradoxa]